MAVYVSSLSLDLMTAQLAALLKKEEIRDYIKKNPTRFTNIEYMNLFKITTANRERDDAAIDWIEDILKASERKSAAAGKRR